MPRTENNKTKICCLCKQEKSVKGFYKCKSNPDGYQYRCINCHKKVQDTDERRNYSKQYGKTEKGLEGNKKASHKYHQSPKGQKIHKAYHLANKDKRKSYRLANKKRIQEYEKVHQKIYHLANPEKRKMNCRRRKALKRNAHHEPYKDNYIFERDAWICGICGRKINKRLKWPDPLSKSIDHIVPLIKGGDDSPINVQAAHLRCNIGKHIINKGQLRLFG